MTNGKWEWFPAFKKESNSKTSIPNWTNVVTMNGHKSVVILHKIFSECYTIISELRLVYICLSQHGVAITQPNKMLHVLQTARDNTTVLCSRGRTFKMNSVGIEGQKWEKIDDSVVKMKVESVVENSNTSWERNKEMVREWEGKTWVHCFDRLQKGGGLYLTDQPDVQPRWNHHSCIGGGFSKVKCGLNELKMI